MKSEIKEVQKMPRGGSRAGAGRPKKERPTGDGQFATAQEYLTAVVKGEIAADPARITAARTLIQYERGKARAPAKSPPPEQLRQQEAKAMERGVLADFEQKAAEIRARRKRR